MKLEELRYWATIGVRIEKAKVWEDYLAAIRNGDERNRARLNTIYSELVRKIEPAIVYGEIENDE